MKRNVIVGIIIGSLLFSAMFSYGIGAEISTQVDNKNLPDPIEGPSSLGDPNIEITYPKAGNMYFFNMQPIQLPIASTLGLNYCVMINRDLVLDTSAQDVHHAKFIAKRVFTGWETVRYDYRNYDGLSLGMGINSGLYEVTAYAYDEFDNVLDSDTVKVLFIRVGREDFGVWINTKYNGGETLSQPLNIGLTDFTSMLNTGDEKQFKVTMQQEDDTLVNMRFIRTKILNNSEEVIQTNFNIETTCDTTKSYEVSAEIRFPFVLLEGGEPDDSNNPYFSMKTGYHSVSSISGGPNKVNTTFYFGRKSMDEPRVFRLHLKPDRLDEESQITYFTSYLTVDESGNEVFQRIFSLEFDPATELTITTIPREAKVSYGFGESAGMPTRISFRAEGGLLDDIIQSMRINPLPSYMAFDLTIIGVKEFIYDSDQIYDVEYTIDSVQNGNLVSFLIETVPKHIYASWGLNLGTFGDLSADGFAKLDMSHDVERLAISFFDSETPFIEVTNFPRKFRVDSFVDILGGTGNLSIQRGIDEFRVIDVGVNFDDVDLQKTIELKNDFVEFNWDINLNQGTGNIEIRRDAETEIIITTQLTYQDWMLYKTVVLNNNFVSLSWDVDRDKRMGSIIFERDADGQDPSLTLGFIHNGLEISSSIALKNHYIELFWDLTSNDSTHAEIGINTEGDQLFEYTLQVIDDTIEILSIGVGIKTTEHFSISWDYENGVISNFDWSGKVFKLSNLEVSAHLPGDFLTLDADWQIGDQGSLQLTTNKEIDVNFVDVQTSRFKIFGHISFDANKKLGLSWRWDEFGYFTVNTFDKILGDDFEFKLLWDPQGQGNYRFGFNISSTAFLNTYVNVSWFKNNQTIPTIWVIGDPLPLDWMFWHKELLWNYQWWQI